MVSKKKNTYVFLDVSVDGDPAERMVFELFHDVVPKTAENFRALCTGEKGIGPTTGKPLHYKGSFFHRIVKGLMAQAGDFSKRDGSGGESIYGEKFEDESFKLTHDGYGFLSMANDGPHRNGSQFLITFKAAHHLDGKHVVFGKLVQGRETLKKIEHIGGSEKGKPECMVKIVNCGEHLEDKKKANKLKANEVSIDADDLEVKRRGKHKKTSKDRRRKKRRRYYSSESDSSSDSETESSEFDSDSDSDSASDSSSSSDISSSSEDRHKKRKRVSKKGKHRRGKKRDKRREKRRRRRDKKARRKSRRTSESSSDSESDSTSENISDDEKVEARGCSTGKSRNSKLSAKNQSPSLKEKVEVNHVQKNGEMTNALQRGGESPQENGKLRSNGTDTKSARNADRQPDLVDAHPSKSRSTSPKRIPSKSMSISPRCLSKSPSVSPKRRSLSRSSQRSVDRSPAGVPRQSRSVSQSPDRRSVSSRSPVRSVSPSPVRNRAIRDVTRSPSLPRRSISRSPVRSPPRRSTSRSLIRPPAKSSRRSSSRSPMRPSRRSLSRSRSPVRRAPRRSLSRSRSPIRRTPRKSPSRSPGRVPPRRSISRSPVRPAGRSNRRRLSKSPVSPGYRGRSPIHNRGRSASRSASPDGSPKRLRRGRGFSQKYWYARRYRTPSPDRSPIRSHRYGGRGDRDRYPTYRSYRSPPRRHRSPLRGRTPPRYRGRRSWSRSRSLSRSPPRNKGRGKADYSRSPTHSRSPVEKPSSRGGEGLRSEKRRSVSRSSSRSKSVSRSSGDTPPPKRGGKDVKSRSPSASPPAGKGLVSYGDGSPDSSQR
ncbi:peptidyl-prolyl cis-trans isomerase CYP95-like isoform X2 [Papaver somniferum]|uniref:peptidyl-prolyl cis-trans isomerase CYP95-like isoform X2 n=1 Tax=Papaver somniferum TaxID=3469 RepID=UPI000E7055BB|nr:peptidyl-prolyl cis-trans isomerase CYP95-like isoform X2 [Papaver somniferum]